MGRRPDRGIPGRRRKRHRIDAGGQVEGRPRAADGLLNGVDGDGAAADERFVAVAGVVAVAVQVGTEIAFAETALALENCHLAWQTWLEQWPDAAALHYLHQSLPHLSLFYLRRGRAQEGATWLAAAWAQIENGAYPTPLAAHLAHQLAKQEEALGQYQVAQERLLACLPRLEADGQWGAAADTWEMLGQVQRHLGDGAAAARAFHRCLELYRQVGRPTDIASVLNSLGVLAKNKGEYGDAAAYYQESLDIFRQQGDRAGVTVGLINLGNIANVQGDYAQAQAYYQEGYELAAAAENRPQMGLTLLNLGSVTRALGDGAAAVRYYEESLALAQKMAHGLMIAAALDGLGQTFLLLGDGGTAQNYLRQALEQAIKLGAQGMILTVLASVGQALYLAGRGEAATLLTWVLHQENTAYYVQEEVRSFAAAHHLTLPPPQTINLTLDEASYLALSLLPLRQHQPQHL